MVVTSLPTAAGLRLLTGTSRLSKPCFQKIDDFPPYSPNPAVGRNFIKAPSASPKQGRGPIVEIIAYETSDNYFDGTDAGGFNDGR